MSIATPGHLDLAWDDRAPVRPQPRSADPNDIIGPTGVGPEQWVPGAGPLNYTIRFENDPLLANAPAQFVRVRQTLDADLDPRSFRLGSFGFGNFRFEVPDNRAYYSTRLDLRSTFGIFVDVFAGVDVAAGQVFWTFTSIDPQTGERPTDPLVGFLPPNITTPEGDGFVNYTVRARTTAPTGSRIDAEARICFDDNAPIDTPPIFNTLDNLNPTASVAALDPIQDGRRFRVAWSGGDGTIGSGLATYSVFVSINGGPFNLWLDKTNLTDAEYAGNFGSRYAFYAVAADNVGNTPPDPDMAQAATTVKYATVARRGLFYNNSTFDGNNPAANSQDDGAFATDKTPLFNGQRATFANYTSYTRGINGLMIDVANLANLDGLTASDFLFRLGNTSNTSSWRTAPAPLSITIRPGEGLNGTDRIVIIWADGVIRNTWLQITLLASANTGIQSNDVFYFGNAVGESGNSPNDAAVNTSDILGARGNPGTGVPITNRYDYNRDGVVNAQDVTTAQSNGTAGAAVLQLITPFIPIPNPILQPPKPINGSVVSGGLTSTTDASLSGSVPVAQTPPLPPAPITTVPPSSTTPPVASPVISGGASSTPPVSSPVTVAGVGGGGASGSVSQPVQVIVTPAPSSTASNAAASFQSADQSVPMVTVVAGDSLPGFVTVFDVEMTRAESSLRSMRTARKEAELVDLWQDGQWLGYLPALRPLESAVGKG